MGEIRVRPEMSEAGGSLALPPNSAPSLVLIAPLMVLLLAALVVLWFASVEGPLGAGWAVVKSLIAGLMVYSSARRVADDISKELHQLRDKYFQITFIAVMVMGTCALQVEPGSISWLGSAVGLALLGGLGLGLWSAGGQALTFNHAVLHLPDWRGELVSVPWEEIVCAEQSARGLRTALRLRDGTTRGLWTSLRPEELDWLNEWLQLQIQRREQALTAEGHDLTRSPALPKELAKLREVRRG